MIAITMAMLILAPDRINTVSMAEVRSMYFTVLFMHFYPVSRFKIYDT